MFKQCWQIFLTYLRRWLFWPIAAMFLMGWVFLVIGLSGKHHEMVDSPVPHLTSGFFFIYFFGLVVYQLKEQIAKPQASIIPGYRVPHLVTALAMTLPTLVIAPVVVSVGFGLPILPLLSFNVALSALVAWGICRNSWIAMTAAVACWLSPAVPQVHTLFLDRFITDHAMVNSLAALPVLILGIGLLALTARRLLALREEMPEYPRIVAATVTNRSMFVSYAGGAAMARQVNYDSRWFRWVYAPNERQLARGGTGPYAHAGFWRRVAHQRAAYISLRMAIPVAVMVIIMFTMGTAFSASHEVISFAPSLLFLMPAVMTFMHEYGRWPMLGYEMLHPAKRRDFVLQNAVALVWNVAEMWLVATGSFIAMTAVLAPEKLGHGEFWMILAASAMAQVLMMPMAWWLLRLHSTAILIGLMMSWGVMFAPFAIFTKSLLQVPPAWLAAGAGAVLLAGTVIALDAYRRWMRADLA
jgi:hypothetical protein